MTVLTYIIGMTIGAVLVNFLLMRYTDDDDE